MISQAIFLFIAFMGHLTLSQRLHKSVATSGDISSFKNLNPCKSIGAEASNVSRSLCFDTTIAYTDKDATETYLPQIKISKKVYRKQVLAWFKQGEMMNHKNLVKDVIVRDLKRVLVVGKDKKTHALWQVLVDIQWKASISRKDATEYLAKVVTPGKATLREAYTCADYAANLQNLYKSTPVVQWTDTVSGSCFLVPSQKAFYGPAASLCKRASGRLAHIATRKDFDRITSDLFKLYKDEEKKIFVGLVLKMKGKKESWNWVDGEGNTEKTDTSAIPWDPKTLPPQPEDRNPHETVGVIQPNGLHDYRTDNPFAALCEVPNVQ